MTSKVERLILQVQASLGKDKLSDEGARNLIGLGELINEILYSAPKAEPEELKPYHSVKRSRGKRKLSGNKPLPQR